MKQALDAASAAHLLVLLLEMIEVRAADAPWKDDHLGEYRLFVVESCGMGLDNDDCKTVLPRDVEENGILPKLRSQTERMDSQPYCAEWKKALCHQKMIG